MVAMVKTSDGREHYNDAKLLSHNAVWNWCIGARGLGKSYAAKTRLCRNAIKNGSEGIYLRRTVEEQKKKETFFSDIASQFPDISFRVNGSVGEYHRDGDVMETSNGDTKERWRTVCYFHSLSQAGHLKSVPYPKVTFIFFDEIFPMNGRYLPDEATQFSEYYSTIDRYQDRTRVFFAANALSTANPYFARYGVDVTAQQAARQDIKTYDDGFIAVELADYRGFSVSVAQSRFGRFITNFDPSYAAYAIGNEFKDAGDNLVFPLERAQCYYSWTLCTPDYGEFHLWITITKDDETLFIISRRHTKERMALTFDAHMVTPDCTMVNKGSPQIKALLRAYQNGRLRFDNTQVRNEFMQVLGAIIGGTSR